MKNYNIGFSPEIVAKTCRRILKTDPNDILAHYYLGQAFEEQGKLLKAVDEYQEVLRIDPHKGKPHYHIGNIYQSQGKLEDAIDEYVQAIKIVPNQYQFHFSLGTAYEQQGKFQKAIYEYKEASKTCLDCDRERILTLLGSLYIRHGKMAAAIREFQKVLTINPDKEYAHFSLGIAYNTQGKFQKAIQEYAKALELNPDSARVHVLLGNVYKEQGRLDEAVKEFQQALEIDIGYVNAHYFLGDAYVSQNNLPAAIEEFRATQKINPDHLGAHHDLGIVFEMLGQANESMHEWKHFINKATGNLAHKSFVDDAKRRVLDLEMKLELQRSNNRIIYGLIKISESEQGHALCFLGEERALWLNNIWKIANGSKTWGEFLNQLPLDDAQSFRDVGNLPLPEKDEPLHFNDLCLFYHGQKLEWPFFSMLRWIPEEIKSKYGKIKMTMVFGDFLYFNPIFEAPLVASLKQHGYILERNDELIQRTNADNFFYFVDCE